jgi:hypothetical protein
VIEAHLIDVNRELWPDLVSAASSIRGKRFVGIDR